MFNLMGVKLGLSTEGIKPEEVWEQGYEKNI
jgi:hypothetical protein